MTMVVFGYLSDITIGNGWENMQRGIAFVKQVARIPRLMHKRLGTHFLVLINIWLVRKLNGWLVAWLVGWFGWLVGWLAACWLAEWLAALAG